MYTVCETAIINGAKGKYDNVVNNPSARYGRNAISNHIDYLKDYKLEPVECEPYTDSDSLEDKVQKIERFVEALKAQKLTPINFKLQYMPQSKSGVVDADALMGASYEEMGKRYFISVDEMNERLNPEGQEVKISAGALDLNHDSNIDLGEYAASILLSDMLSTNSEDFNTNNINGIIKNEGENALLREYANNDSQHGAYLYLYNFYNLKQAAKKFVRDPNNCVIID